MAGGCWILNLCILLIFLKIKYSGLKKYFLKNGFLGFFLKIYLFIFREKAREGEREEGKHQCVVASRAPPTGDLACVQACALSGN